jgi:hypothetical protein
MAYMHILQYIGPSKMIKAYDNKSLQYLSLLFEPVDDRACFLPLNEMLRHVHDKMIRKKLKSY